MAHLIKIPVPSPIVVDHANEMKIVSENDNGKDWEDMTEEEKINVAKQTRNVLGGNKKPFDEVEDGIHQSLKLAIFDTPPLNEAAMDRARKSIHEYLLSEHEKGNFLTTQQALRAWRLLPRMKRFAECRRLFTKRFLTTRCGSFAR